ncbi:MAG TPA: glycosyltransferase [Syntrophomonas sp.]|nr:glycosyltransferase [Syntrophomonas sp.]
MDFIRIVIEYTGIFFIAYLIGYSTFLFLSVIVGGTVLFDKRKKERLKNVLNHDYYMPITIIVPAYNEEVTVVDSVKSLLSLDYQLYEIVVVDDGSSDSTSQKMIEHFDMKQIRRPINRAVKCKPVRAIYSTDQQKVPITLIKKENGGKADALNMGINASKFPYFICMDADSVLQQDSLKEIMNTILEDNNIIAAGGLVRPSNGLKIMEGRVINYRLPPKILVAMQTLEYERSFLASRLLLDQFNGNLIISGAFGMFKKDIVIDAGGYDHSTIGEDMELVVKLHVFCRANNRPYLIKYAPDAICWTQVPERLHDLTSQRRRWHLGLFQSMWKYKEVFANPRFGAISWISYFYFLVYELASPFIELFGIITIVLAFLVELINVKFMIMFFLIYVIFGVILTTTAFINRIYTQNQTLYLTDIIKATGLCVIEISVLRFIMAWVRITAFIGYNRRKTDWGKIERQKINLR